MQSKIVHWGAALVAFTVPVLLGVHQGWQDLTIGGVLNAIWMAAIHYRDIQKGIV